ncbi:MAG: hypothetical protein COU07_03200 [Candidatus Harrisonbacteria bacterium CG10_big_fil_rev_8_21_14_0_10_40_38]|uniref:Glycosyltransferase 2-like domain-containing protein n=1 Tax=Candidatus Harrisonbacteria bacterium CG10_big_fil_rev_8_21_14_0_10_40_38 TaxID=1974583 RepID=A0A2H0URQ6_9BACT|nr:MAG: hypothetical protein COU07_03200 [Candidatus Harrisonbacteria bacterium CG10_big_fil_rev_8_21_14_0_10_40_38]
MGSEITIITRTYEKSVDFISVLMESFLNQTIADKCEFLIIDNDSPKEGTIAALKPFMSRITLWQRDGIKDPMRKLNDGVSCSRSPFIMNCDHDDLLYPECAEKLLRAFSKSPEASFSYCDYYDKYPDGSKTLISTDGISGVWNTVAGGMLFRRDHILEADCYDEALMFPEYDLLLKMFALGMKGVHVPGEPLWEYARTPGSMSDGGYVTRAIDELKRKYGLTPPIRSYER